MKQSAGVEGTYLTEILLLRAQKGGENGNQLLSCDCLVSYERNTDISFDFTTATAAATFFIQRAFQEKRLGIRH